MKLLLSYIRLVRPLNLFIIAFTLYMVRAFFFFTSVEVPVIKLQVIELIYALFSFSFICMAAAGYIINDYYDVEIDKINKPGKVIIGNIVSPAGALRIYWQLNCLGIIAGFLSCYLADVPLLGVLFLFYLVALWFYSYKLKATFLLGNFLIGLCIALVPLGGAFIELAHHITIPVNPTATLQEIKHQLTLQDIVNRDKPLMWLLLGGVALFAFISTVMREIVKDVEDIEGDAQCGCRTMPVVIGIKKTKWVIFSLLLLLNILLGIAEYYFYQLLPLYSVLYFIVFMEVPIALIFYKLKNASQSVEFHSISNWLKILMLTGTIYVFSAAYLLNLGSLFVLLLFS